MECQRAYNSENTIKTQLIDKNCFYRFCRDTLNGKDKKQSCKTFEQ